MCTLTEKSVAACTIAFVAFLLGPEARFFCGSVIFVDGGTDAHQRADDHPTPMGGRERAAR
jgi:hypothetical protein